MSRLAGADPKEELLSNDDMRIGCFERTCINMTKAPSVVDDHDSKI